MTNPKINITIKNVGTKPVSNGYQAYIGIEDTERDALKLKSGYFSKWFEEGDRADDYIRDLNKGDDVLLEYKIDGDFLNILHVSKVGSGSAGDVVDVGVPKEVLEKTSAMISQAAKEVKASEKPVEATGLSVEDKLREEALLLSPGYLVRVVGHYREAIRLTKECVGGDEHLQVVMLDKVASPLVYLVRDLARQDRDKKEREAK